MNIPIYFLDQHHQSPPLYRFPFIPYPRPRPYLTLPLPFYLVQDTNGVCIRGTDVLMFKEQISSLPEWTAWGVGQHNLLHKLDGAHFEGNRMQNICSMAKGFVDGESLGEGMPQEEPQGKGRLVVNVRRHVRAVDSISYHLDGRIP